MATKRLHEIIQRPPPVVLVRGNDAKQTLERLLTEIEQKPFRSCSIPTTTKAFCDELEVAFSHSTGSGGVWEYKKIIIELLREGTFVILDGLERANEATQVFLQVLIDELRYQSSTEPRLWERASSLVLLGSHSDVVDSMVHFYKAPLFRRINHEVTFSPDDEDKKDSFKELSSSSPSSSVMIVPLMVPFLLLLI